jgi:hypothetical protein
MHMKVSHDQFEIHGDKLRHTPTGALFWMGESDAVMCDAGLAGTDMGAGHDYDPEQLKQAAYEVFKLERGRCA